MCVFCSSLQCFMHLQVVIQTWGWLSMECLNSMAILMCFPPPILTKSTFSLSSGCSRTPMYSDIHTQNTEMDGYKCTKQKHMQSTCVQTFLEKKCIGSTFHAQSLIFSRPFSFDITLQIGYLLSTSSGFIIFVSNRDCREIMD